MGPMKRLFYVGLLLLVLFELANVYFIMPMPGSQRMRSIDLAYLLYRWRWVARLTFGSMATVGFLWSWRTAGQRWLAPISLLLGASVVGFTNTKLAADRIFLAPSSLVMRPADRNTMDLKRLVVGIAINGDARAYPIQFIGYHHQVRDTVGGRPVMVTFCTVCRTGRVFDPVVDGRAENFRLVGMDHFNAMFEDRTTGSWWQQATGHSVAGARKGMTLAELPAQQVTLGEWLAMHPGSLIMQPDPALRDRYSQSFDYETGASRSALTGTDPVSWHDKSWVVGVELNGSSKAYDWNRLRRETVVNDAVGGRPIVLVLARDGASFFAFERPNASTRFELRGDSLVSGGRSYALANAGAELKSVPASQEFWHSWRTFHPGTATY